MELQVISQQMTKRIKALTDSRSTLKDLAITKANAITEYEKKVAITIIKLRNGMEAELEGEVISNPPVTVIDKVSKGMCWQEKLEMEKSEALYKAEIVCMNALQAELNGLQSLNKYVTEV